MRLTKVSLTDILGDGRSASLRQIARREGREGASEFGIDSSVPATFGASVTPLVSRKSKMSISTFVVSVASSAVLLATLGTVSAQADPPEVLGYRAQATATATHIAIDSGTITVRDGVLAIESDDGVTVAGTELSFRVDDFTFPVDARVDGRSATLTPLFDLEHATYSPVALPFDGQAPWKNEYEREQAAWTRMTTTIALGGSLGTLVGGLGGAAVGCVLGGIAGATVAAASIAGLFGPFIPAAAVGCLGGILAVGALGTLAGQILVTAPVAVMAAVQYFTTITSPVPAPK